MIVYLRLFYQLIAVVVMLLNGYLHIKCKTFRKNGIEKKKTAETEQIKNSVEDDNCARDLIHKMSTIMIISIVITCLLVDLRLFYIVVFAFYLLMHLKTDFLEIELDILNKESTISSEEKDFLVDVLMMVMAVVEILYFSGLFKNSWFGNNVFGDLVSLVGLIVIISVPLFELSFFVMIIIKGSIKKKFENTAALFDRSKRLNEFFLEKKEDIVASEHYVIIKYNMSSGKIDWVLGKAWIYLTSFIRMLYILGLGVINSAYYSLIRFKSYIYIFAKKMTHKPESIILAQTFRISVVIAIVASYVMVSNGVINFCLKKGDSIYEFIASVIIIPVMFKWISDI